jgi:hypothetical protein
MIVSGSAFLQLLLTEEWDRHSLKSLSAFIPGLIAGGRRQQRTVSKPFSETVKSRSGSICQQTK